MRKLIVKVHEHSLEIREPLRGGGGSRLVGFITEAEMRRAGEEIDAGARSVLVEAHDEMPEVIVAPPNFGDIDGDGNSDLIGAMALDAPGPDGGEQTLFAVRLVDEYYPDYVARLAEAFPDELPVPEEQWNELVPSTIEEREIPPAGDNVAP